MTISHIFDSVDLTEAQKQKIDEAFETALQTKLDEKIVELEQHAEDYGQYLVEQTEEANQKYLAEHVHPYFEDIAATAAKEFIAEHKEKFEAISGNMLAEGLLQDMKQLFEKHNVSVPEAESQLEKLAESNRRINALMAESRQKDAEIEKLVKTALVEKATVGLTESQKDKISDELMQMVFVSEEQFTKACTRLVESIEEKPAEPAKPITENTQDTPTSGFTW